MRLSDTQPVACTFEVLRRTDEHIWQRSGIKVSYSGDEPAVAKMGNSHLETTPDNDPRWGQPICVVPE